MEQMKRVVIILVPCIMLPLIVAVGVWDRDGTIYAEMSLLVAIVACVLVILSFEKHTTHVRKIVLISVMTSLSVLGRFVFAVVPGFKPMTAVIVITAMYLGKEAGFLTGVLTALLSNMYFGQGPWTPFQMLSFGWIGFFAGILRNRLKHSTLILCLYGIVSGVFYSFVMDIWTVLWYQDGFSVERYLVALGTAVPYTLSYAISNVIFLCLLGKTIGKRLNRMVLKYRI